MHQLTQLNGNYETLQSSAYYTQIRDAKVKITLDQICTGGSMTAHSTP